MLRIFHSLPRTHKLLLLPVATMVTVLGTHKILAVSNETDITTGTPKQVSLALAVPTSAVDTQALDQAVPKRAQSSSSSIIGRDIPLIALTAQEVVDLNFIETAQARETDPSADLTVLQPQAPRAVANAPTQPAPASQPPADEIALDAQALHIALQLFDDPEQDLIGGTSYEDLSTDPMILDGDEVELENELVAKEEFVPQWETYTVQKGDTFAVMAERTFGLGYSEVLRLLDSLPNDEALTNWRVGDNIDFQLDEEGQLLALRVMNDARSGYLIERNAEQQTFDIANIEKAGEATQRLFAGTVSGSFAGSAGATGLSYSEVAELSNLLSKKIDFRRDTRRGDHFQVLVEADMVEGKTLDSRILAARYEGERTELTVVRNPEDDRFYTPDGQSLDPAFDRYPFEGHHRISSPFNLRRHHPITGRISPHRGTDFAMRTGSVVEAPADGRVIKTAFQAGGAGNYLVIRHDNGYKTRYMHLSKSLVKEGERVTMGQKIALSGNTGGSTGPHLHYEVMVNNRQVDAMRVKLPENKSLSGQALASFKQQSEQLLAKLETSGGAQLARASTPSKRNPDGS
ncbi:peptidoglycan DD-metalloendopeptidase family protein [Halomonas sp. HP20-15]|uniref:peptidoglycan DD-metalloendopeptidase family protein n=1 Tax=Halomonas sp. HP20-15 TaxID=3085901 RepID=UPI002982A64B|nr:peptidoglycan DD-metalloendopeptidase family protein [Halomonas sp. HP20-15]MDW5377542.1 peptidoglycan DD-metalloendopeptidase family protein [Halomonas sp. HP20-15]